MSTMSREEAEALVMAAVLAVRNVGGEGPRTKADALSDARWALSQPEIRTALAGGGGGEKHPVIEGKELVCGRDAWHWWAKFGEVHEIADKAEAKIASLESSLATAEKRAEEAEEQCEHLRMVGAGTLVALSGGSTDGFNPVRREGMPMLEEATKIRSERDALKAELAEAKRLKEEYYNGSVLLGNQRDAALARVKELEAKLATIRDAAGAQP